jgi:hypothetical protein
MRVTLLHDHYDTDHLADVVTEMRSLGAPTIKAIWDEGNGCWIALEGCHRLRAASELGLTPEIDAVEYGNGSAMWSTVVCLDDGLGERDDRTLEDIVNDAWRRKDLVF